MFITNNLLFDCASQYLNAPYKWGENGPFMFDCSGLFLAAYREYQKILHNVKNTNFTIPDMTADGIYRFLAQRYPLGRNSLPLNGCALFYGTKELKTHVSILGPSRVLIEAGGAGEETKNLGWEELLKYCSEHDARVRLRRFGHRNDFVEAIKLMEVKQ